MTKTLSENVGPGNVYSVLSQTSSYSVDGVAPERVFFPGGKEELAQILLKASQSGRSVIPWGNGTKMGWGSIPSAVNWVVCTKCFDRITDPDYKNLTVAAQAGTPLSKVQELLKGLGRGYVVPLDPPFSKTATLGGVIATNSSGPKRHLYGTARDLILGMKVIGADGKQNIWGGKTVKNVAGYDMPKLYVGSFGTLGIVTEVTLRVLPLPERESTLLAIFGEDREAFLAVSKILQSRILPSAVEIMDCKVVEAIDLQLSGGKGQILLAVHIEGFYESVQRQIKQLRTLLEASQVLSVDLIEGPNQETFWTGLRDFELIAPFTSSDKVSYKVSLPVSKTGEAFHFLREITEKIGLDATLRCHAGTGIIYGDILLLEDTHRGDERVKALNEIRTSIGHFEGTMIITAAPVTVKREIDVWGAPGKEFRLMRELKNRFDPHRLLNPGRFVGGI